MTQLQRTPSAPHQVTPFDDIRNERQDGSEFWSARDLQQLLGYSKWENFQTAITRAIEACESSKASSQTHFPAARKMAHIGGGNTREVLDYHLTRYAAYLVAMNSDPSKGAVALAQTYFTVQTRKAELAQAPALPASPLALSRALLEALEQQDTRVTQLEQRLDSAPITSEKVGVIFKLGQELGAVMGNHRSAWRLFKDRFGLASYRDLPSNQFEEGQKFLRMQIAVYTGRPLYDQ